MNYFKRKVLGYVPCDSGGGGGGSSSPATSTNTSYTNTLQPELMPYATDIAKKAQDLSASNYTPFQNERIADFNPNQQQVQSETMGMGTPDQFFQGSEATRVAGLGSMQAGDMYNQMATDPSAMGAFMSPYMQNVVDTQKQQALLDYQRGTGMNEKANAARQGAFGGNRQAITQGMNQDALLRQLGQIQATGTQNAFQNAQQSMQYGSDLGLRGMGQAGQMAGQLANIGGQEQQADLARLQAQGAVGGQQQALKQQQDTQGYQDFLKQQEYPYSQLAFYNSMIRGLQPVMPTTTQTYAANPSTMNQVASLGLGAYGISNLMGKKKGGAIKGFAVGGGIGELARQEDAAKYAPQQMLQRSMQTNEPFLAPVAKQAYDWQNGYRTAVQGQEAQQTMQQPSVLERMQQQQQPNPEMQGLGSTGADVGGFADGGIIGFDNGGAAYDASLARTRAQFEADKARWAEERNPGGFPEDRVFGFPTSRVRKAVSGLFSSDAPVWENTRRATYENDVDPEAWGVPMSGPNAPKPQGTPAASKKAAAATGKKGPAAETGIAAAPAKINTGSSAGGESGGIKVPSLDDDIATVGKYADAASTLTKKERDALEAAEGARKTRAEEGKERRLDTAKGLAALQAAQALTQVGKPGITAFGEALGAAGKVGAEYQGNEEKIAAELEKADIAHKQGILALRKGDVETGTKLAEKRDSMMLKAKELEIMDQYRRGMINVEQAKIELAKLELPSKIRMHDAMASKNFGSGAAKGQITPDLVRKTMISAETQITKDLANPMARMEAEKAYGVKGDALKTLLVKQYAARALRAAGYDDLPDDFGATANPNFSMGPPSGTPVGRSLFGGG